MMVMLPNGVQSLLALLSWSIWYEFYSQVPELLTVGYIDKRLKEPTKSYHYQHQAPFSFALSL